MSCLVFVCVGLDWTGLVCIRTGLDWLGLDRTASSCPRALICLVSSSFHFRFSSCFFDSDRFSLLLVSLVSRLVSSRLDPIVHSCLALGFLSRFIPHRGARVRPLHRRLAATVAGDRVIRPVSRSPSLAADQTQASPGTTPPPAPPPSPACTFRRPDIKGRKEIFDRYLKGLNLSGPASDFSGRLAGLTPGFAGADIENLCNEAAIVAARKDKRKIDIQDFEVRVRGRLGRLRGAGAERETHGVVGRQATRFFDKGWGVGMTHR